MFPEEITVLIVDDEEDIRAIIKSALSDKGCAVTEAPNAEQAVELLAENKYDLVLSDIKLPGMNGFDLLNLIKKEYPHIGVIMMTAYNESHDLKEALLVGAEEYISKPFDLDELYNVVEKTYWRCMANTMRQTGNMDDSAFGKMLISMEIITETQLQEAIKNKKEHEKYLAHTMIRLDFCKEQEILPVLADHLGVEYIYLKEIEIDPQAVEKVPAKFAYHYKIMPIRIEGNNIHIATMDPLDVHVLDDIRLLLGFQIVTLLASEEEITESLKKYYGIGAETVERMIDENIDIEEIPDIQEQSVDGSDDMSADASIIKFVNQILLDGYKDRATDIHIEPFENEVKVRYRIDGILYETNVPPTIKRFQSSIVSRIKIMASLNIAERRLPQDGRIKMKLKDFDLDLRVSTLPTPYGETVNIRILAANTELLTLNKLGYENRELEILDKVIMKPHGIILVTGPTGSGKSTTLYACLKKLNSSRHKIITIEDPIEYRMPGISQIQVLPKIDLTFARALRSMLRHDPDIMMIGEIRDYETAEASIRAALTGHLVFSTIHTNDSASSVTRLIDMGVEPYLVSSSVECVIAQRLIRLICPKCKQVVPFDKVYVKDFRDMPDFDPKKDKIYEGAGCEDCKMTGFKGRSVIYEVMLMTDNIREMIVQRTPANIIKEEAIKSQKMATLKQTGLRKAIQGLTSVKEVLRVAQEEILD